MQVEMDEADHDRLSERAPTRNGGRGTVDSTGPILRTRAWLCPASRPYRRSSAHRLVDGHRYSTARTWAQTTIIPMNRVIDASAAASSTTARIMMHLPLMYEHK